MSKESEDAKAMMNSIAESFGSFGVKGIQFEDGPNIPITDESALTISDVPAYGGSTVPIKKGSRIRLYSRRDSLDPFERVPSGVGEVRSIDSMSGNVARIVLITDDGGIMQIDINLYSGADASCPSVEYAIQRV